MLECQLSSLILIVIIFSCGLVTARRPGLHRGELHLHPISVQSQPPARVTSPGPRRPQSRPSAPGLLPRRRTRGARVRGAALHHRRLLPGQHHRVLARRGQCPRVRVLRVSSQWSRRSSRDHCVSGRLPLLRHVHLIRGLGFCFRFRFSHVRLGEWRLRECGRRLATSVKL